MRKSVKAHVRDFFTYGGEFGRDDYWKAIVIRILLFVLLYLALAAIGVYFLALAKPDSWLEEIDVVLMPIREFGPTFIYLAACGQSFSEDGET